MIGEPHLSLRKLAELLSLGMTVPTVVLCSAVVWTWGPAAKAAWHAHVKSADQWFILGVAVGFIGAALDNLYWAMPWTASYLEHPSQHVLVASGVFANVVCRQALGIVAAYCHLKAAMLSAAKPRKHLNELLVASHVAGLLYCVVLIWMRMR